MKLVYVLLFTCDKDQQKGRKVAKTAQYNPCDNLFLNDIQQIYLELNMKV